MHSTARRIQLIFIALALLMFSACSRGTDPKEGTDIPVTGGIAGTQVGKGYAADDVFSLNSKAADGFNPYTSGNAYNRLAGQLVYENIFEVDDDFNLSSRIVEHWETSDGAHWYFTIDNAILMHDGEKLTAKDVSYSLQRALIASRYEGRFSYVWGASATSDTVFAVTLSAPNMQFPYLMTIPVIKYGSISEDTPAGTGPYRFAEDKQSLIAFDGHPDRENLPVDSVGLVEYDSIESIITAFEDSYIDLVVNDPTGGTNLGYGGNNETRYYTTNNMHYLGFNMKGEGAVHFLKFAGYRYALQFAVDRSYAAKTLMNGAAVASTLPISPKSPLYDETYAAQYKYDLERCLLVLNNSGAEDYDEDGKLEYMVTGIPMEIELDMIVCSEASGKAEIAKKFAEDLATIGLRVNVRELSWAEYQSELQAGNFDIYYGEVKLTADFSLTRLLNVDGDLNYCGISDETYGEYIAQYLAADDEMREYCLDILLRYINENAPIVPILFERHEVITHRSVASGLKPGQYNIFYDFSNWSINMN